MAASFAPAGPEQVSGRPAGGVEGVRGTEHLARVLAAIGGYVDGVGYLALYRLFIAHQSGNSAGLGVALGTGDWADAWPRGIAIGAYVVGIATGTLLVELGRRGGVRSSGMVVSVAELVALGVALAVGEATARAGMIAPAATTPYAITAACLAGAMGLQTVTLRRVGRRTVRTTFVTGVLTNLAESFVLAWFRPDRESRRRRLSVSGLLGSVWLLYLGGAVAGAAAERAWAFAALAVPMVGIAVVTGWARYVGYEPSLPDRELGE